MLTKALIITIIIAALFVIAGVRETRRGRALREWALLRAGARLLWPFMAAEQHVIPVTPLIELFMGRPPLGLACAMQVTRAEDEVWFVEFRATPAGQESSRWFTLVARHCQDGAAAKRCQMELQRTEPERSTLTLESWTCQRRDGLMTVALLEEVLNNSARSAGPRPVPEALSS